MPHISATRLRLRRFWLAPAFIRANEDIIAQTRGAPGFLAGKVIVDRGLVFWTCTLWQSSGAMQAFRDSGAHRDAMPKLLEWCNEASVAQWQSETMPGWDVIHTRIREGRRSRLRFPNANHELSVIPPPRPWLPERPIARLAQNPA